MPHDEFLGAISLSDAPAHPHLDVFMLTGFLLAFFQVACYISRRQSRDMAIGLLLTSLALSLYAIAAGVWPLAMVQCALAGSAALRLTRRLRSHLRRRSRIVHPHRQTHSSSSHPWSPDSRLTRLFGPPGSIN